MTASMPTTTHFGRGKEVLRAVRRPLRAAVEQRIDRAAEIARQLGEDAGVCVTHPDIAGRVGCLTAAPLATAVTDSQR